MPVEDVLKHLFHHIIVMNVKKIDRFEIYLKRR